MKRILMATAFMAASFGAFAKESAPKKAEPAPKKLEHRIEIASKDASSKAFRRQMSFVFYDACGQQLTVYVSGPSTGLNSGNSTFYLTALEYANGVRANDGCFPHIH